MNARSRRDADRFAAPPRRGDRGWLAVPLAAIALVAILDVAVGHETSLIGALVAAPLLCSFRLGPAPTAAVAALALLASFLLGLPNDFFGESSHMTRMLPVALGGALSVWLARLRAERERAALLFAVQGSVSRTLNESSAVPEAARRVLEAIGGALGWQVGALWEVDKASDCLRLVERWRAPDVTADAFETASAGCAFERGQGLPGRVWASGSPASIPLLAEDEDFPRAAAAAEGGLRAGFAFPVQVKGEVGGVIEFFSVSSREPDPAERDLLAGLGRQIGDYMERRRGEGLRAELLARERAARLGAQRAERQIGETAALLDTLLGRGPVGFAFVDTDLRLARVNDALAGLDGRSQAELVGRSLAEALPALPQVADAARRVLETGEPVVDVEVTAELQGTPAVERHWLGSCYPVRVDGELLGVGAVVVEITERKRAEARASFLADATAVLNEALEYEETLQRVARMALPELGDWCVVDVVEPDRRVRRLAVAHTDPAMEELVWELTRRYPMDLEHGHGAAAAIRTGQTQVLEQVDDSLLREAAVDEEQLRILRDLDLESALAVPLVARGRALGALSFASTKPRGALEREDVALAEELARRAAVAIDHARLYGERSHIARTLQASLLPPRLPAIPGVEVVARYRAAGDAVDVGGDFYDVFAVGQDHFGAVIGDVLGKGPGAAALIGLTRHTLHAAALRDRDPARVLATVNEALVREGGDESFCTAVYAGIAVADGISVELTSAGHPLPLLQRADGTVERVGEPGTLLGVVPEVILQPRRVELAAGEALVLFTDGVIEARSDGRTFGESRLKRLVSELAGRPAAVAADRIEHEAVAFQGGEPSDDLAILVIRRTGGDPAGGAVSPGLEAVEATT